MPLVLQLYLKGTPLTYFPMNIAKFLRRTSELHRTASERVISHMTFTICQ